MLLIVYGSESFIYFSFIYLRFIVFDLQMI